MSPGCEQHLQSDLVSVCGGADTETSWDGAGTERRVDLGVGEVEELTESVSDIRYCKDKG